MKTKKRFNKWILVAVLAAVCGLVSAAVLLLQLYDYKLGTQAYYETQVTYARPTESEFVIPPQAEEAGDTSVTAEEVLYVNFDELRAKNPDVIGWIDFDALDISYPILYSGDNDKYLRRLWTGADNTAGSIFMEMNNQSLDDRYVILYGHNMRNDTMFGSLDKYRSEEFYRENGGWLTLYTPDDGIWRYEIYSVKQVTTESDVYSVGFSVGDQYTDFLRSTLDYNFYDCGVTIYTKDKVLCLSTCVGDDAQRLVVFARRAYQLYEG